MMIFESEVRRKYFIHITGYWVSTNVNTKFTLCQVVRFQTIKTKQKTAYCLISELITK